jgi:hypothetical protein
MFLIWVVIRIIRLHQNRLQRLFFFFIRYRIGITTHGVLAAMGNRCVYKHGFYVNIPKGIYFKPICLRMKWIRITAIRIVSSGEMSGNKNSDDDESPRLQVLRITAYWNVTTSLHCTRSLHRAIITSQNWGTKASRFVYFFFVDFPIYLQSVDTHSANGVLGGEGR